jgi:hypothetical protein
MPRHRKSIGHRMSLEASELELELCILTEFAPSA